MAVVATKSAVFRYAFRAGREDAMRRGRNAMSLCYVRFCMRCASQTYIPWLPPSWSYVFKRLCALQFGVFWTAINMTKLEIGKVSSTSLGA